MDFADTKTRKVEVTLYHCNCDYCKLASRALAGLAEKYGATVRMKSVYEDQYMAKLAGWSTPIVCVNGQQISRYSISKKQWEQAIKEAIEIARGGCNEA